MRISKKFLPVLLIAASINEAHAKKRTPKIPDVTKESNQDEIAVQAHLANPQGVVTRFIATPHWNRLYVYAEREDGKSAMLLDVTRPDSPQVLSDFVYAGPGSAGSLLAVAGTAALASDVPNNVKPAAPQTIRILNFSDPTHPRVQRQFDGVTAVERTHGIILLANPEGIWILSEHLADDPELEAEYARRVRYQ